MAPRPPIRTGTVGKPLKSILKTTSLQDKSSARVTKSEPLFSTSKKDKRLIKHAQLLSKVSKSATQAKTKRRRPNKKLVTTLDALMDALPDNEGNLAATKTDQTPDTSEAVSQVNVIRRKSLKSKPGAMKRREKVDKDERNRFAKNMAQMATTAPASNGPRSSGAAATGSQTTMATATSSSNQKWVALRSFISQTLEQRPDVDAATT